MCSRLRSVELTRRACCRGHPCGHREFAISGRLHLRSLTRRRALPFPLPLPLAGGCLLLAAMADTRPKSASTETFDNPMKSKEQEQAEASPPSPPERSLDLNKIHKTLFEQMATEGEGHYLVAVGASCEFANGIYRRMPEEHDKEGQAVYASGAGFTISREVIEGEPGWILGPS